MSRKHRKQLRRHEAVKKKKNVETKVKVKGGPDWMSQLPEHLLDVPLTYLAIPGSHNSLSYTADKSSDVDRSVDPIYRQFVEYFGHLASTISHRWTVTQTRTITEQLDLGIRYLELRVTARKEDDSHVYFRDGQDVRYALRDVDRWTDLHKKEIVLIDFTELHRLTETQHKRLLAYMSRELFGDKLLGCAGSTRGVTIRNMWGVKAQIIIFYPKQHIYDYTSVWPQIFIGDVGTSSQSTEQLIEKLDTRYQHGHEPDLFYRWLGVLVPDSKYLDEHVDGKLKSNLSQPALRAITNWVRNKDVHDCQINIVVADFVEQNNFCTEVIEVNYGPRPLGPYDFEKPKSASCTIL